MGGGIVDPPGGAGGEAGGALGEAIEPLPVAPPDGVFGTAAFGFVAGGVCGVLVTSASGSESGFPSRFAPALPDADCGVEGCAGEDAGCSDVKAASRYGFIGSERGATLPTSGCELPPPRRIVGGRVIGISGPRRIRRQPNDRHHPDGRDRVDERIDDISALESFHLGPGVRGNVLRWVRGFFYAGY